MNISQDQYSFVSETLKTVSHPVRLMILCQLIESPKTVSELESLCKSSQSQISQFLNRMRREKIVSVTKKGRFAHYSLANMDIHELITSLNRIFCNTPSIKKNRSKKKDLL